MNLAPVIVFAYNRPEHLKRTLEMLALNEYAKETLLYIFCDGAKPKASQDQNARIDKVREVAKEAIGFREVQVVCAEKNKGLANSIIGGVTEVINKHGRVIVLEDDLLTSPYFLKYMNTALDKYESYPAVFSISANRPPVSKMFIPADYPYDVFVSLRSYSTGWATWKEKWDKIDWSLDYLEDFLNHPEQIEAFNRGGDDMTEMLCLQRDHRIDSWAIRYAFQHFYHHAVAILPCVPYVDNIGFDGTGTHSGDDERNYRNDIALALGDPRMPAVIYEDKRIINAFYNSYCRVKRPWWQRVINTIYRKLGKSAPFVIKKKVYC